MVQTSAQTGTSARPYIGSPDAGVWAIGLEDDDARRRAYLDALTKPRYCRACGCPVTWVATQTSASPRTVCGPCGGRKTQDRLERDDATRANSEMEGTMVDEAVVKVCSTPNCGTKLRRQNQSGLCTKCRTGGGSAKAKAARAKPTRRRAVDRDVREKFEALTSALGFNGEQLVDDFCQGWIDSLKAKAQSLLGDDTDGYRTPMERAQ